MLLSILLAEEIQEVAMQTEHSIIDLFTGSDFLVQLTLLILLFFSVTSWAIIGMKYKYLKKMKERSQKFISSFWGSKSIEALIERGSFLKSPVFHIFKSGITSLKEHKGTKGKERIAHAIRKATDEELEILEGYVPFLATTASATPFIGLFGTVWGILNAFWKLGNAAGTNSIAVIGPHIAEALSSTAFGLMAAIPALIFYNFFVNRIRTINRDMNQFAGDLENRIEDEYLK